MESPVNIMAVYRLIYTYLHTYIHVNSRVMPMLSLHQWIEARTLAEQRLGVGEICSYCYVLILQQMYQQQQKCAKQTKSEATAAAVVASDIKVYVSDVHSRAEANVALHIHSTTIQHVCIHEDECVSACVCNMLGYKFHIRVRAGAFVVGTINWLTNTHVWVYISGCMYACVFLL